MLHEEQIDIRRQRAREGKFQIENLGKKRVFSDYRVLNPQTGGQYLVSIRGLEVGDNSCTCPDFKTNTLGTCKHIEAVLESLHDERTATRQRKALTAISRRSRQGGVGRAVIAGGRMASPTPPRLSNQASRAKS